MKKKVLILFKGAHLSYSPSVIALYDLLSAHFEVTIMADSPKNFDNKPLTNRNVIYKTSLTNRISYKIHQTISGFRAFFDDDLKTLKKMKMTTDEIYDFEQISKYLSANNPDLIIAADFKNLIYTKVLDKKVEYLSLELTENADTYEKHNFDNINSVIIQTKERYEYLFKDKVIKTFYIQNAPIFKEYSDNFERKNLVYCGTAWNQFGFYHCLEFLKKFPEYALHVKGSLLDDDKARVQKEYRDLISDGRLRIDNEYLDDSKVVDYLRQFRIGFCFYNFEIEAIDNFNYYSAPSGKMFKYLAAGVPVIGQQILGLQPVKDFDCGVLIENMEPRSIKEAIEKIEGNFDYYSQNCLKAAAHYSFDKTAEPFVEYLLAK